MIVEIDNSEHSPTSMANQMVHFWRGEPLNSMSKDELISIIVDQARMAEVKAKADARKGSWWL